MGNPEDPGDASIAVNPTCVRVPVFYGHAEAVHVGAASAAGRRTGEGAAAPCPWRHPV